MVNEVLTKGYLNGIGSRRAAHAGFCNGPRRVKRLMGWDHPDSADSDTISLQGRLPCLPSKPLAKRAII